MKKYIVIILIVLGAGNSAYGEYEFEYTIKKGDNLWDIAIYELHINPLDFPSFVEDVKQANPWITDDDLLYCDRKLKLTRDVDVKYAASDHIKTDAIYDDGYATIETIETKSVKYKVQRGENLWYILSAKYNLRNPRKMKILVDLCLKLNPSIRNPNILWVGQKILLPEITEFGEIGDIEASDTVENEPLQEILNEAADKTPAEVDKLFNKIENYQLLKNSLIVISFGRYELKVKADRLLISQDITAENQKEYLINYITSDSQKTSKNLKNLLKEKNYILIEIIVK